MSWHSTFDCIYFTDDCHMRHIAIIVIRSMEKYPMYDYFDSICSDPLRY